MHILPSSLSAWGPCALLACLAAALPASASTFNISPIRAQLSGGHRTEVLTLMNADDRPVVVQIHVVRWSQQNGEEQLDDTRELLATPPVLQIPAMSEQIVRVALRRDPDASGELAYRVIFEEVPQAAPKDFSGLQVALRLSVPVFVAPAHGGARADVSWESHRLPSGQLEVAATNHGNGHLQVTDFGVQLPGVAVPVRGITTKYILPGSRMSWVLASPPDANVGPVIIHGHSDQGEFSADAAISRF
ncbi:MAG: fimbria/pilus periplasmic chaperone [Pseudomonadota bacterium]|nr:fimbria/pilus periplasmic chaperone [Pseudomonadota bacterium]